MKKYVTWRMAWFIYLLVVLGFITYLVWFQPNEEPAYTTTTLNENWSLELKVRVNAENKIIAISTLKNISSETIDAGGGSSNKCLFGPHIRADFVDDNEPNCPFNIERIDVKPGESIISEKTFERPEQVADKNYNVISVSSNGLYTYHKFN